ncbi:hypothetical protein LZG00_09915 [Rhodobacteraceae bacterium LMO-12]|nr:hypothetical protein [Rhodobacteraceae bacterium LMO-JJ12]
MIGIRQLLRMSKWARHPPSTRMVIMVAGIIVVALVIAGIEHFIGWPDALSMEPQPRRPRLPLQ